MQKYRMLAHFVGDAVGEGVGNRVGDGVGDWVGSEVGDRVGERLGGSVIVMYVASKPLFWSEPSEEK